jgi:hypothetical protein
MCKLKEARQELEDIRTDVAKYFISPYFFEFYRSLIFLSILNSRENLCLPRFVDFFPNFPIT